MLKRFLAIFGALALFAGGFIYAATTANAAECHTVGLKTYCGQIRHYTPDAGYDEPIRIRCDYGDPSTNHLLYEGENSPKYCKDTDQVYVRSGEELWCKLQVRPDDPYTYKWYKIFDATGWHKISDVWDDGKGCTLRVD